VAPVHHGVEVEVDDRLGVGGEPAADHRGIQRRQEAALVVVAGAVGVVGERGLLGQHRQPGEQGGGRTAQEQVVDVGDLPGAGQLQRQQRQRPRHGGHHPGPGVAGGALDQPGQVEGDQVGHEQQQPLQLVPSSWRATLADAIPQHVPPRDGPVGDGSASVLPTYGRTLALSALLRRVQQPRRAVTRYEPTLVRATCACATELVPPTSEPRSGCPIDRAIEAFGDRWSLLVLRDVMFGNRRHFRELLPGSAKASRAREGAALASRGCGA